MSWYFKLGLNVWFRSESETETGSKRWDFCRRECLPNVSSRPTARGLSEGPAQQINIALSLLTPCPTGTRCWRHTQMVLTRNIFLAAAHTQPRFPYCQPLHLSPFQTAARLPVSLQFHSPNHLNRSLCCTRWHCNLSLSALDPEMMSEIQFNS